MRIRRLTAVLLAASLALGLAGCGKDDRKKTADLVFQTAPYYAQEDMPTAAPAGMLLGCCTDGESIWYLSEPGEDAAPVLCRVPLDGSASEILPDYQAPEKDGTPAAAYWGPILGGDGKLWVWERFVIPQYDLPEGFDPETDDMSKYFQGNEVTCRVRQLEPASGKELRAVDITGAMEDMDINSTSGFAVDASGTVFLSDRTHIVMIDGEGQTAGTLKALMVNTIRTDGPDGSLALLPDGTIGVLTVQNGDGRKVRAIDPETRDWAGVEYYVRDGVSRIFSGRGKCAFYYISDKIVYGAVPGEEVPARLLPWDNAMLDHPSDVRCFVLMEDGQAVIFSDLHESAIGTYDDRLQVTRLLPMDEEPEGAPVKLVYGTIGTDYGTIYKIEQFNLENQDYRIEYRDYAEGLLGWTGEKNTTVYQNALTRLYADIAAGYCPDILDESVPLDALAAQGALEDLWPWIDGDPDISRDGLLVHVLECLEVDGKLPRVCSGFKIETAVASAAVAGDRTGWTMEEMLDAFGGEMPDFYFERNDDFSMIYPMFHRFDRKAVLYNLVNMNLNRFVNTETGECDFDSDDFKSLLRLAGIGEDVPESGLDLSDVYVRMDLGLTGDIEVVSAIEPCQVFPWEGKPLLYARTLADAKDLVIDDVLFGGREPLTDYDQRLWDGGIIYNQGPSPYTGEDLIRPLYFLDFLNEYEWIGWATNGFTRVQSERGGSRKASLAADCQAGGADGSIYASYVGFPSASGAGSSFTICQSMGISASSKAKEAAWAFVRGLLLPEGNVTGRMNYTNEPFRFDGFSINRETFDQQMRMGAKMEYWTDPYTGEVFTDANGDPVEFTPAAMAVGQPGDIVLMAFLFTPSEAQLERFWRLYESTEQITGRNDALLDIVTDQADVYFAGDKSLEETVQLIQNRAKLYVDEHR